VQTTRALLRGIAIVGDAQLVLMDTPGSLRPPPARPRHGDDGVGGAHDADIVALLIDAKKGSTRRPSDPRQARDVAPAEVLVLNKIDLADKPRC
jgi:GTP-binding protein Era